MRTCRLLFALLCLSGLTAGCMNQHLDTAITQARQAKFDADTNFTALAKATVAAADEAWAKKHELQERLVREKWARWLREQGMQQDPSTGAITGGTIEFRLILPAFDERVKEEKELESSRSKWAMAKAGIMTAIERYEKSNVLLFDTEQDAMLAKQEAQAAIQAALQTVMGAAAGALGTAVVAP